MVFSRYPIALLLATLVAGCISSSPRHDPIVSPRSASPKPNLCTVFLVRHGWHTGLALRRDQISTADWPESAALAGAEFIEVGWGDEAYYRASFLNPIVMVNAACLPSRSAIHVTGIRESLSDFFHGSQIVSIEMTTDQMRKLCRFIHDSYRRDAGGNVRYLQPALYGSGGIYAAKGYYFVPNTCNVWTAKALAAADCPVAVSLCTIAQPLVLQTRIFGREIQKGSASLPVIYPFTNFDRPKRY